MKGSRSWRRMKGAEMSIGQVFSLEIPRAASHLGRGHKIIVQRVKPTVFKTIDTTLERHGRIAFHWNQSESGFIDLDHGRSPVSKEGKASTHLSWCETSFMSTVMNYYDDYGDSPLVIVAETVEEIEEALTHIEVTTYDPGMDRVAFACLLHIT